MRKENYCDLNKRAKFTNRKVKDALNRFKKLDFDIYGKVGTCS